MGNSTLFILILVFQICSATGLRRSLHEPLFPNSPTSAPSPAPAPPPDLQSEPPPRVINNEPFFPLSPPAVPASYTPPAPPSDSIAANVTTTPKSNSNSSHKKLVAAFAVCGSLVVVFCLILFCLRRYRKRAENEHWGWAATKFSADTTPLGSSTPGAHNNGSNARVLSPAKVVALNGGSDALYLGTFANRTVTESQSEETALKPPSDLDSQHQDFSPLRNATKPADRYGRGSPEIHPLPPLEKKPPRSLHSPDSSDDESFYSPKGQSTPSRHGSPMIPPPRRSLFSASFERKTPKSRSSLSSSASSPKRKVQTRLSFSSSGSSSSSAQTSPSLDSPTAPITPTVTTPPIRAHSNSPPRHYSLNDYAKSHQQHLSFTSKPQPSRPPGATVVASNTELKRAPPPPPPLPPPFKPLFPPSNSNFQNPKGNNGHLNSLPLQPDLPPLPVRPAPRFLSSSRSGKLAQSTPASSRNPPPPPPSGLFCSRTGQPLQALQTPETPPERSDSVGSDQTPKTKLKPLHWDKVRASPRKPMVWDQLKSGSFQLDEEMIESLFVYSTPAPVKPDAAKQSASAANQNRLLDPKKSQNIAILLRALNVTREEVCEALLDGTYDSIGTELLETLSKMAPSRDEEIKLKEYSGDVSKIGTSERFLKALLEIPFAFKRIDAMLYKANFEEEIVTIKKSFKILEAACQELTSSRLFLKLLEAVLKTGNRMNVGTARGDAQAFKLDTLLKLVDVKGTDGKTTLLHFVVLEIIKAEGSRVANDQSPSGSAHGGGFLGSGDSMKEAESKSPKVKDEEYKKLGLEVVAGLSTELSNVKSAAGMDSEGLAHSVTNLARGLDKLKEILQMMQSRESNEAEAQGNFLKTMSSFLERAEQDIDRIQEEQKSAFAHVRETTEYFHGDAIKEEARPLRFFMVVRDFLGVLDQVCREIGRTYIKVNKNHNLARHTVIAHPISMPVFARAYERRYESSDDDSSSSS